MNMDSHSTLSFCYYLTSWILGIDITFISHRNTCGVKQLLFWKQTKIILSQRNTAKCSLSGQNSCKRYFSKSFISRLRRQPSFSSTRLYSIHLYSREVIVYFFGILISFLVEIIKTKIKNIYCLYLKLPELTTYMYTNNHSRNIFQQRQDHSEKNHKSIAFQILFTLDRKLLHFRMDFYPKSVSPFLHHKRALSLYISFLKCVRKGGSYPVGSPVSCFVQRCELKF